MAVESPIAIPASIPEGTLEPNAIGVVQDTVIGMATSAPAASAGLTLAALAAATAYASGSALIIMAVPMIVIANCYRRLNLWNANCGASFEWVGRLINPYLGFMTGWLMIMGGIIGTVSTDRSPRPFGARRLRLCLHCHPAQPSHRHGGDPGHARDRDCRDPPHRSHSGRHGAGRVRDPYRFRHRRPGRGNQPSARHFPHLQGLVELSAGLAVTAASPPGSWSRCLRIPAGTAPFTSTRRSSTGA